MKLKYSWIVFILSAILLIPVKLYSAITGSDFTIGNMPSSTSSSTFITVTIILVLVIIIMSLIPKNVSSNITMPKNIFCGVIALLSGIAMIISGILNLLSLLYSMDTKIFFFGITIILSGIAFIFISSIHLTGKNIFVPTPLLALLPTIWACVRLAVLFLYNSSIDNGKVDTFDIISSAFLILFFFSQSKIMAYIPGSKLVQKLFAFGLPYVLMSMLYNFPLICTITSINDFSTMYVVDMLLVLYIISLLITLSSHKYIDPNATEYRMYSNRQD